MSVANMGESPHEIIIVKHRGGEHEDGHHGGVWKIAFADFMTAMMCFFLVMWLINATNEQTKAAVASYFNPVKLIDRSSSKKGLEDVGDGPNPMGSQAESPQSMSGPVGTEGRVEGGPREMTNSRQTDDTEFHSDEHLFADPYAVLAEIVGETGIAQNISAKGDGGAQTAGPATGASGGESYRDPFAPDFWVAQVEAPIETEPDREQPAIPAAPQSPAMEVASAPPPVPADPPAPEQAPASPQEAAVPEPRPIGELFRSPAQDVSETEPASPAAAPAKPDQPAGPTEEALEKARQIKRELAAALGSGDALGSGLDVVATSEGVTISVTDEFKFGMFEIGSAVPRKELVLAMEKIGKVLASREGSVIINGHTDARPFRSASYDNWRLSTARAHAAYYMLVRAGLGEERIKEVAGFADRSLKVQSDPLAAANRRIEILLRIDG